MPSIYKSQIEPYSPKQMFDLVNDVESYPKFLPWCKSVSVISRTDDKITAIVNASKGPFNKSFTTCNLIKPHESIIIKLVNGPFKELEGFWSFSEIKNGDNIHCKIEFKLDFMISMGPLASILNPVFEGMYSSMIQAFSARAKELYG